LVPLALSRCCTCPSTIWAGRCLLSRVAARFEISRWPPITSLVRTTVLPPLTSGSSAEVTLYVCCRLRSVFLCKSASLHLRFGDQLTQWHLPGCFVQFCADLQCVRQSAAQMPRSVVHQMRPSHLQLWLSMSQPERLLWRTVHSLYGRWTHQILSIDLDRYQLCCRSICLKSKTLKPISKVELFLAPLLSLRFFRLVLLSASYVPVCSCAMSDPCPDLDL
jgi:hypothetical protein